MGYSDFNSCAGVVLSDGTTYVCEIQLNHIDMLAAKKAVMQARPKAARCNCSVSCSIAKSADSCTQET